MVRAVSAQDLGCISVATGRGSELWKHEQGNAPSSPGRCRGKRGSEDTLSSLLRIVEVLRIQWDVGPGWRHGSIW